MLDLFRMEAESQVQALTAGLLALEREPAAAEQLESCMRAAHSLKGAARIIGLSLIVGLAHAMEDCFVAAQQGRIRLGKKHIDLLLHGADWFTLIATVAEAEVEDWMQQKQGEVDALLAELAAAPENGEQAEPEPEVVVEPEAVAELEAVVKAAAPPESPTSAEIAPRARRSGDTAEQAGRVLRVTANNLNRLLGLAGESRVESRWLKPFSESLLRLKRLHRETGKTLEGLREALSEQVLGERAEIALADLRHKVQECQQLLSQRLVELELFDSRSGHLAGRLYDEALACRMRPFADGTQGFPRMVRDLARTLGKELRLELIGEATQVDRDILEKLDAPLGHLLRNAVDHGIDAPQERLAAGKPAEGVVRIEARHSAGMLQIVVSDDGRGIELERLRQAVVQRNLSTAETAARLSDAELMEFLFLPGFSMKGTVTDISGRGVGLDAVQDMIRQVRGTVRIFSEAGKGTRFQLQLPLTLSVVRTLLVDIAGEPYAFPLAYIVRSVMVPRQGIEMLEGRQLFNFDGRPVGLVSAHQILGSGEPRMAGDELPVIVVGEPGNTYGLVVDCFLGERELVVQPLDARLGKIKDIAAGGLMEDGSPVLIVDVDDILRSVDKLASGGRLSRLQQDSGAGAKKRRKRVLIVDDSLTVRELERKLLEQRGYEIDIAVDGMDGWNAVRVGHFDLLITDIDMPRMDGIELVALIRKDPNLKSLPVMVVSYKDREEDRRRGLEAGADYYLSKGSFHDESLMQSVMDLIGEAEA